MVNLISRARVQFSISCLRVSFQKEERRWSIKAELLWFRRGPPGNWQWKSIELVEPKEERVHAICSQLLSYYMAVDVFCSSPAIASSSLTHSWKYAKQDKVADINLAEIRLHHRPFSRKIQSELNNIIKSLPHQLLHFQYQYPEIISDWLYIKWSSTYKTRSAPTKCDKHRQFGHRDSSCGVIQSELDLVTESPYTHLRTVAMSFHKPKRQHHPHLKR